MEDQDMADVMSIPQLVGYGLLMLVPVPFAVAASVLIGLATARPWRNARVTCSCGYRHAASAPDCPRCGRFNAT
jgi:hypothetical protein